MALVELVGSEFDPKKADAAKAAKGEGKGEGQGLGGRLRRAAERVRGRKADDTESGPVHEHTKAVTKSTAKPRQAGRSGKGG